MGLTYRTQILSSWRNLKPAMTSLPARWQPWRHCCCLEQHNMGTMIKTSNSVRSLKNTTSSVVNAVVHHAHIKHIKHGDNCVRICSVIDLLLKRRISEHLRGSPQHGQKSQFWPCRYYTFNHSGEQCFIKFLGLEELDKLYNRFAV